MQNDFRELLCGEFRRGTTRSLRFKKTGEKLNFERKIRIPFSHSQNHNAISQINVLFAIKIKYRSIDCLSDNSNYSVGN